MSWRVGLLGEGTWARTVRASFELVSLKVAALSFRRGKLENLPLETASRPHPYNYTYNSICSQAPLSLPTWPLPRYHHPSVAPTLPTRNLVLSPFPHPTRNIIISASKSGSKFKEVGIRIGLSIKKYGKWRSRSTFKRSGLPWLLGVSC